MNHNVSYAILNNLRIIALEATKQRTISKTEVNSIEYFKTNTDVQTKAIIQSTITISKSLLKDDYLTNAEKLLILDISNDVKYCNNLWLCKSTVYNNRTSANALKELIKKNIIYSTETKHIYIINPYYIRYGEFYEVLFSTMELCKDGITTNKVTRINPIREQTKFS